MDQRSDEQPDEEPGARSEGGQRESGVRAYVLRHWRGENSLAYAFWINHFLLGILFEIILGLIEGVDPRPEPWWLAILLIIARIAFTTWALVGVWRSAGQELAAARQAQPPRFAFWAGAARVWVATIVGLGVLAVLMIFTGR